MEGRWRREEGWRNEGGGGRSDRANEGVREIYGREGGEGASERGRG